MSHSTALITGASVGIGRATAVTLSKAGYHLILLARREENLLKLKEELGTPCHLIVCDVNDHPSVDEAILNLPKEFSQVDVLINNAGLALGLETADKSVWKDWQTMIETNCLSLVYLTRKLLPAMKERNVGHIINLGSIAGSYAYRGANVYGATKAFVDQFSINLRADLLGSKIRVTNLEPGMIGNTEFSNIRFHGDDVAANAVYDGYEPLLPEDIAESIRWVVKLPPHVNINSMEIMPTCQAPGGLSVAKSIKSEVP